MDDTNDIPQNIFGIAKLIVSSLFILIALRYFISGENKITMCSNLQFLKQQKSRDIAYLS